MSSVLDKLFGKKKPEQSINEKIRSLPDKNMMDEMVREMLADEEKRRIWFSYSKRKRGEILNYAVEQRLKNQNKK